MSSSQEENCITGSALFPSSLDLELKLSLHSPVLSLRLSQEGNFCQHQSTVWPRRADLAGTMNHCWVTRDLFMLLSLNPASLEPTLCTSRRMPFFSNYHLDRSIPLRPFQITQWASKCEKRHGICLPRFLARFCTVDQQRDSTNLW